ncbi:MAG: hypothetical protein JSS49_00530 [Planctomycetes bacterium]|nr:hypothetical protein [Planctomycetota bacterium]
MSSLIVLCPHCLTWVEPHAQCCTECGGSANTDENDPASELLAARLGTRLLDLGPVKLLRRGWPACGQLLATTKGLLFIPRFTIQPSGAMEATTDETPGPSNRVAHLFHWWSIPPWRRPVDEVVPISPDTAAGPPIPVLDLLLDSPGGFFIQRSSIQRISLRWGRAYIERPPSRSVTLAQWGSTTMREALRLLIESHDWRSLVTGL